MPPDVALEYAQGCGSNCSSNAWRTRCKGGSPSPPPKTNPSKTPLANLVSRCALKSEGATRTALHPCVLDICSQGLLSLPRPCCQTRAVCLLRASCSLHIYQVVVEFVVCHILRQVDVPSHQRIPSTGARDHITWLITPWYPQPIPHLLWDPRSSPPRVVGGVLGPFCHLCIRRRCFRSVRVARCLRWRRRCFRFGAPSATIIALHAQHLLHWSIVVRR